ncbi:hypothetical protein ACQSSU_05035 [Micromonospora echinospora]
MEPILLPLGDGHHFRTADGRLILRDDTARDTVEVHELVWTTSAIRAVRLDRCGEPYGKGWLSLYLSFESRERAVLIRRHRVEALMLVGDHLSRAVPLAVRLRLAAAARRGETLQWHLTTAGFRALTPQAPDGRWYRLDAERSKSESRSLLCHVRPGPEVSFYSYRNLLGWPPDVDGSNQFYPRCKISDLIDYHERTDGESTPEVPAGIMPYKHFHTADGRIVCSPSATGGLIKYPFEPVDFGYGYFD